MKRPKMHQKAIKGFPSGQYMGPVICEENCWKYGRGKSCKRPPSVQKVNVVIISECRPPDAPRLQRGGKLEQDSLQLLKKTALLQEDVEVRIYQNEEAVRCSLQAKRESPYRLLIDESVPAAILLSCQMQCTVPVLGCSVQKAESVLGRQKPHFSDEIEKQSIMQKANSVNAKPHYNTFNPGT